MKYFPVLGVMFVAIILLGSCVKRSSIEIEESANQGCEDFVDGVDQTDPNELYLLGTIYATNVAGCKDPSKAEKYYAISANMGHVPSQSAMCILSQRKEDYIDAVMWCVLAASGGHEPSKKRLAQYNNTLDKEVLDAGVKKAEAFYKNK